MVTAALSILLGSNWPAEPVSLWVETQTLICDQFLAELRVSTASANLPKFLLFVCERKTVCMHIHEHLHTVHVC